MQASATWQWVYQPTDGKLVIELDDTLQHHSPYKESRLARLCSMRAAFDLEDAEVYQAIHDALNDADFSPMVAISAGLNAAILNRFGRPQMPQSWYFQQNDQSTPASKFSVGELGLINSGFAVSPVITLVGDSEFAECMVLAPQLQVSEIKSLHQFDTVKVLHNRIQPLSAAAVTAFPELKRA
ncbi:cell division protein ZapC domain-containing protein [Pseudidiomarina taiwanensis]|uniref:cell division protein ZapC domain-containing protein n=1 Tax=Pseudidiomarina taiwanensis TaxID=337250 RepID=UPI0013002A70|nr:cell division protein ZapC domain-containing protein [Pseudidiomarina taiwanensis]